MNGVYNSANLLLMRGKLALDTDTLTVLLLTSEYAPNFASHSQIRDVAPWEVTADGYKRQVLQEQRIERDDAGNEAALFAADLEWASLMEPARYCVVARGQDLIGCMDFGAEKFGSDGLRIEWTSAGVLRLQGAIGGA